MYRRYLQIVVAACLFIAGVSILILSWLNAFVGNIRIQNGTAEAVAVASPTLVRFPWENHVERMAGRNIPFAVPSNASGWIDENRYYDVTALPFAIAVTDGQTIRAGAFGGALVMTTVDGQRRIEAEPGSEFRIGAHAFTIGTVRPWRGLVAAPGNSAMAALAITSGGAELPSESIFVPSGAWVRLDGRTALHFQWVESSDAAEQSFRDRFDNAGVARWGIVSDDTSEWLTSFQPGSGLAMNDGTSVTLIQRDDNYPGPDGPYSAIEVALERGAEVEEVWIRVNEIVDGSPVRYEDLTRMPVIIHAVSWEPGQIWLRIPRQETLTAEAHIEKGETWSVPTSGIVVRLDDVLSSATAIGPEESYMYELVATDSDRQVRIPEHRPVSYQDTTLRFEPEIIPPDVQYSVSVYEPGGDPPDKTLLGPDDEFDVAGWVLSQDPGRLTSGDSAVLQVRRTARPDVVAAALAAIGVGILLSISACRKKPA